MKNNEIADNRSGYPKPTESPAPRFFSQSKIHRPIIPRWHSVTVCRKPTTNQYRNYNFH